MRNGILIKLSQMVRNYFYVSEDYKFELIAEYKGCYLSVWFLFDWYSCFHIWKCSFTLDVWVPGDKRLIFCLVLSVLNTNSLGVSKDIVFVEELTPTNNEK